MKTNTVVAPRRVWSSLLSGRLVVRTALGLLLALLTTLLLTLAFTPYGVWPLVFVAFVPMIVAQYRVLPARISNVGSALAIGGWVWAYFGPVFAGTRTYMVWLPLVIGGFTLLMDAGTRVFHERTGYRWFMLSGVVGWVGVEVIRSQIPQLGTWGFIAYTLYAQPWLVQPISLFGIYALGLLIMLVNFALGFAALALVDRRWPLDPAVNPIRWRQARPWLLGTGIATVAWIGVSLVLYQQPTPTVRVAAIHWNRQIERFDDLGTYVAQFAVQTRRAAAQGADLIVWPEIAIVGDPQQVRTPEWQTLARETRAYLVLGYGLQTPAGLRNEATVLSPDGRFLGVFGKDHPVVFGGETSISGGTYPTYPTPFGTLGTIICYDGDFTDTARKVARNGAQIIAVPSHDWPAIADKHWTHLVFRAVENRVALVKSDGSGNNSAIIDPYGNVVQRVVTPGGAQSLLVADVAGGSGPTLAVRLGDGIGWLSVGGLIGVTVLQAVVARRARQAQAA